jgi:hypothetical protein
MSIVDVVMNRRGRGMQCEEVGDWRSVAARLLSLGGLAAFRRQCNLIYADFHSIRKDLG